MWCRQKPISIHSPAVTRVPICSDPAPLGHVVDLARLSPIVVSSHRDRKWYSWRYTQLDGTYLADNQLDGDSPMPDTNTVTGTGLSRQNSSANSICFSCYSLASPMLRDLLLINLPCFSGADKLCLHKTFMAQFRIGGMESQPPGPGLEIASSPKNSPWL